MIGIYKIVNVKLDKYYIGSSKDVESRIKQHKYELKKGMHHSKKLQKEWDEYGEESFVFEAIEECRLEFLLYREGMYINKFDSVQRGYNTSEFPLVIWRRYNKTTLKNYTLYYERLEQVRELADTLGINLNFEVSTTKISKVISMLQYLIEVGYDSEVFKFRIKSFLSNPIVEIFVKDKVRIDYVFVDLKTRKVTSLMWDSSDKKGMYADEYLASKIGGNV